MALIEKFHCIDVCSEKKNIFSIYYIFFFIQNFYCLLLPTVIQICTHNIYLLNTCMSIHWLHWLVYDICCTRWSCTGRGEEGEKKNWAGPIKAQAHKVARHIYMLCGRNVQDSLRFPIIQTVMNYTYCIILILHVVWMVGLVPNNFIVKRLEQLGIEHELLGITECSLEWNSLPFPDLMANIPYQFYMKLCEIFLLTEIISTYWIWEDMVF